MEQVNALFKPLNPLSGVAHWAIRIGLAGIFLYHGILKFGDLAGFAGMVGGSTIVALLVALAEVAAGILILAGPFIGDWATRLAGLFIFVVMVGAIFMVHLPNGWNFMSGGAEFQTLTALLGLFLFLKGNSIDDKVGAA